MSTTTPTHDGLLTEQGLCIQLHHTRGDFRLEVDLRLPASGITAIFGHSGSGKTSLLRCVAGLDRPERGLVGFQGETWQDSQSGLFVPPFRRPLGYIFQEANLFPHLSIRQNLAYGMARRPSKTAPRVEDVCELLGIAKLLDRGTTGLSGGERQRVAIARALLTSPRLLLMDEPLASLDHARRREILPYFLRLNRDLGVPILYVTHSPEEVVTLADHLVLLDGGRGLASGPVGDVLARLDLPDGVHDDFGVVIDCLADGYDEHYKLQKLAFKGGLMQVPTEKSVQGSVVRIQVKARDVSLCLERPPSSSILNLIPCTVLAKAKPADEAHVLVRLDANGAPLLARITRLSEERLQLSPGQKVWAQIKAVALLS